MNKAIDKFLEKIKRTDFTKVTDPSIPNLQNSEIIEYLVVFFENYFLNKNLKKHFLAKMAEDYTYDDREIPLLPLAHLKKLGSLLFLAQKTSPSILKSFEKRLSKHKHYHQWLFELYIGIKVTGNDPQIEFYEILSGEKGVPEFRKELDDECHLWVEVYRRDPESYSEQFWGKGMEVNQHTQEEIDEIMEAFTSSTCRNMERKRKENLTENDIFILVTRITDGYLAKHINFQAFVNSLPSKTVLVIFRGKRGFNIGDNSLTENLELFFQENSDLEQNDVEYITNLFG